MIDESKLSTVSRLALAAGLLAALTPGLARAQQVTTTPPAAVQPGSPEPPNPTPTPAQDAAPTDAAAAPAASASAAPADKPAPLVIYFDLGSTTIRPQDLAVLDKASRLYSEAKPLVMIVSGGTDGVGSAQANLDLSQRRAEAVLRGLVARGIPAERFQVLAKGETEPAVAAPSGVQEPRNRRVEIAWR